MCVVGLSNRRKSVLNRQDFRKKFIMPPVSSLRNKAKWREQQESMRDGQDVNLCESLLVGGSGHRKRFADVHSCFMITLCLMNSFSRASHRDIFAPIHHRRCFPDLFRRPCGITEISARYVRREFTRITTSTHGSFWFS